MADVTDFLYDVEDSVLDEMVKGSPAFVFAVDIRPEMFQIQDGMSLAPVLLTLQSIRQWLRNHIFSSSRCYCAVILLGTKESNNSVNAKHITTAIALKRVDAEVIKEIDRLTKLVKDGRFQNEYGFEEFCLADAFWVASNLLFELKRKVEKHIVLFTCKDDPFLKPQDRVRTFAKVADMDKSKIHFQLVPFGSSFTGRHYKEILEMGNDWKEEDCRPVGTLAEALERCILPKPYHVPLANIPFYISDDFYIPVNIHNLVKEVKLPSDVTLSKETNAPVTSKFVPMRVGDDNEMEEVSELQSGPSPSEPQKIVRYEIVGGKRIEFTPDEIDRINKIGDRRLRLLGFKPRSSVPLDLHIQPSPFIYPSEKMAKGATELYASLLNRCLAKEVVAICSYCPRNTSTVRYVALVPQSEAPAPTGFLMVYLPFGEEVRPLTEECKRAGTATAEQVEVMEKVIRRMKKAYNPLDFPNPKLASYWSAVEALALDQFEPAPIADISLPNYDRTAARLNDLPQQVNDLIYSGEYVASGSTQRVKPQPSVAIEDIAAVEEHYRSDTLGKLKLDQLKNYLRHVGLGAGLSKMKKPDLMLTITQYLDKKSR